MKKTTLLLSFVLVGFLLMGTACQEITNEKIDETSEELSTTPREEGMVAEDASMMFIQNADSGTWAPVEHEADTFLLTLKDVSPTTIYFSDRPRKITGQAPTDKFLESPMFVDQDPPNAGIEVLDEEGKSVVIVVELKDPKYDKDKKELTYKAAALQEVTDGLSHFKDAKSDTLPEKFENVALFIDDCPDIRFRCLSKENEDCGNPKIGTCWSWKHFSCIPCNDPAKTCDHKYKCCKDDCHADVF